MRIIVVGDGKVGHTIAETLAAEDHDVVIIDNDEEALHRSEDTLDVMCVYGNGANAKTLVEAGVDKTDIIIAATAGDETNMLCCLIAKRLGAKYAIARVRDPEYNESLTMLQQELGIDMTINPERATALEISRLLRFPFASNIEAFARGRVEMVEFRAQEKDVVVGIPMKDIAQKLRGIPQVLYAIVERDGEIIIPRGEFVIKPGDRVHVAADMVTITAYFRYLGKNAQRVKDVLMLGGGRISFYLARMIVPMGIRVSIIELDAKKAAMLSEALPEVNVVQGDGTDQDLLTQEGLGQMDAFIALCDRDEENLITGLYAVRQGVPKVVVKNNRVSYIDIINEMGLDSIVTPRSITCANILRYARARVNGQGTKVEKLYRLMNGKAEALEFIARGDDPYIGIPIKELNIRRDSLIAVIVRRGKVIVPFGSDHIEAGDSVIVIVCGSGIGDLNEVIHV